MTPNAWGGNPELCWHSNRTRSQTGFGITTRIETDNGGSRTKNLTLTEHRSDAIDEEEMGHDTDADHKAVLDL